MTNSLSVKTRLKSAVRRARRRVSKKGKALERAAKIGGPAWTRTRNQTVMSADDGSNDVENADEFGSLDRDF
jgi:hypothetical protein